MLTDSSDFWPINSSKALKYTRAKLAELDSRLALIEAELNPGSDLEKIRNLLDGRLRELARCVQGTVELHLNVKDKEGRYASFTVTPMQLLDKEYERPFAERVKYVIGIIKREGED